MLILKFLSGCALLSSGGLHVLAHPTSNEVQRREASTLPATLGMLGEYTIVPLIWEGPIMAGGPDVNLTGTISGIKAQILKLNPSYETHFGEFGAQANTTGIAKRNAIVPPDCNVPYSLAEAGPVLTVIHLVEDSIPPFGRCYVPAGPRVCSVVDYMLVDGGESCATIYVCNDNNYSIDPSCQYLAWDYAQTIFNTCTSNNLVHGQEFDTAGYNVIVSATCPEGATAGLGKMRTRSASHEVQRREPAKIGTLGEYTVVETTWVGPVTPGGPNITLTGNATAPLHDIHQQIRKLNRAYDHTKFGYLSDEHVNATAITKRNAILPPDCNVPYWLAMPTDISASIGLINNDPGWYPMPAGPRVCVVIGGLRDPGNGNCNAIYACNDNPYPIAPWGPYLGDNYAARILDVCTTIINGQAEVHGQVFDTDNYNVIVSGSCSMTNP